MEWDGFIEGELKCERCGKELSDKNGRNPVETYAGTFTGLCGDCERESPYTVKEYFDGAKKISYPPICPSHRRSRETHIAYDDCDECDGKGMEVVRRHNRGNYRSYCEECLDRFHSHPFRETSDEVRDEYVPSHSDWEDDFQNDIEDIEDEEEQKRIAKEYWEKINEDRKKVRKVINEKFEEAKEMSEDEGVEHIKDVESEIKDLDLNKEYW